MAKVILHDWRTRINNSTNLREFRTKSGNWMACAVGDRIVAETGIRAETNHAVESCITKECLQLGVDFDKYIGLNDKDMTLHTLKLIEELDTVFKHD